MTENNKRHDVQHGEESAGEKFLFVCHDLLVVLYYILVSIAIAEIHDLLVRKWREFTLIYVNNDLVYETIFFP